LVDLNAFLNKKIDYIIPFRYGNESGMRNTEFNGGFQNSSLRLGNGNILFPSIDGLIEFSPSNHKKTKHKVILEGAWVNDTLFDQGVMELSNRTVSLEFRFSTPAYNPLFNPYYQYKLVHNEYPSEWSKPQKEGVAKFHLLPPGEYELIVRSIDASNNKSPDDFSYKFFIDKPFYQTTWFFIVLSLSISIMILYFIYLRSNYIAEKKEDENRMNQQLLELKLKAIQSKMNPHFLFNTLNTINYLLATGQHEAAEDYLGEISILVRKFLENSEKTFMTVESEIDMIERYLKIEQKRFPDRLSYSVNVDQKLLKNEIPTLLIQPFVENAIKHGIGNSKQSGIIKVSIFEVDNLIQIEISDTGVGREMAKSFNRERVVHSSGGINIVKDKIKVIKNKYKLEIELKIIDFSSPDTGIKIVIKTPKL